MYVRNFLISFISCLMIILGIYMIAFTAYPWGGLALVSFAGAAIIFSTEP